MRRGRVGAALAPLLVGISVLLPATGPARAAVPGQEPPASGRSIELVDRSPWAVPGEPLRFDLATEGDVGPTSFRLRVHGRVDSVEDLEESLEGATGPVLYRSPDILVGFVPVQPDGTRRVEVVVSETDSGEFIARLPDPGVYPVSLSLVDEGGVEIATVRTPVVRLGTDDEPLTAPELALVLDVAAPPSIEPEGRRELDGEELDRLERLAAVIDGGLVGADAPADALDVTIAPSPDTVDALTASADPRAVRVLDALATTGGGRRALAAPYVPLDVAELAAAGLEEFVAPVVATGRAVLEDRVGPPIDDTIWESTGGVDPASARLLAGLGVRHVLVDGAQGDGDDSPAVERSLVDIGPVVLPGLDPLDFALVDAATSGALVARAADRADAGHLALAELIVRDDGLGSTVAVRVDDVPEASVLARLLPLLAHPETPVAVTALDGAELDPTGEADDGGTDGTGEPEELEPSVTVPDDPAGSEGLAALATEVGGLALAVDTFAGMVGGESARAAELRLRIATSLAHGIDLDRRTALLGSVREAVDTAFDAVTLTGQTDLNLTSQRGTLPLMIRNDNPFPVEVVLRIRSDRLTFPEGGRFEVDATEEITRLDIPVDARASGSVPTFVEILTPDEGLVLDSRRLDVRSTAVSGVGLAISLGALAVLLVWWVRTWRRSRAQRAGRAPGRHLQGR